jgi:hypothetical protein
MSVICPIFSFSGALEAPADAGRSVLRAPAYYQRLRLVHRARRVNPN